LTIITRQRRELLEIDTARFSQPNYPRSSIEHRSKMNGMNGANMAAAGLPVPTPAGHQAELNYIYGMVEELSRQLADNRRVTEDIVSGLGRVRNRARSRGMDNDHVIGSAAEDIDGTLRKKSCLVG
jgi:hypothetical protein